MNEFNPFRNFESKFLIQEEIGEGKISPSSYIFFLNHFK
nr:MAG TPA: hypothetical protein [Caudoviricetes sp.]